MPYANNGAIRIHYEVEGTGPPVVMLHGSFTSLEDWREFGYAAALKNDYRLILIDMRGHGGSDKPHDPAAYSMAAYTSDITAVLDDLAITQAHYVGYSLGGYIGFGLVKHAPERLLSLSLGGAHPYAENMQPFRDVLARGRDRFIQSIVQVFDQHLTEAVRERVRANDLAALAALMQDRESLEEVLPDIAVPCLLYVGSADPRFPRVQECAARIPGSSFFSVPDYGHVGACSRGDLVLPGLREFLARVSG